MINNAELIQKAENRENFDYTVLIDNQDFSEKVIDIALETTEINDNFEPITGQLTLKLNGDLKDLFSEQKLIKVLLKINENDSLQIFAGLTEIQGVKIDISGINSTTTIKALDFTNILKNKKTTTKTYKNVYFCNHQNTGNSLLHLLLSEAGLQNQIAVETNEKFYNIAVVTGETLYEQVLKVFQGVGATFDFTTGFLRIVNIAKDTYTSVYELNKNESLNIEALTKDKQNINVEGYTIIEEQQAEVYIITQKEANTELECYIPIFGNGYYPLSGKLSVKIEDENIIAFNNVTFNIITAQSNLSNYISIEELEIKEKEIRFKFKNNHSSNQTIIKARIKADVIRITEQSQNVEMINNNNTENFLNLQNNHLIDKNTAILIANYIAQRKKAEKYIYESETYYLPFVEVGDIIRFKDDFVGINTLCIVEALKHEIKTSYQKSKIKLRNVEAIQTNINQNNFQVANGVNTNIVNNISNITTENILTILNPQNAQGTNVSGWTTIPGAITIKKIDKRNNFVTIEVNKQLNLSNFKQYEYQISKDDEVTWTNLNGTEGQVEISYLENWSFIVNWNLDTEGKAIDTNVKIRIRQRTRANTISDWTISETITLEASLSAITNNLGQVYCDSVIFNNYNYIASQNFRLGDNDNYIQFINDSLNLQGAGLSIAEGNLITSGNITANTVSANYLSLKDLQIGFLNRDVFYVVKHEEYKHGIIYDTSGNLLFAVVESDNNTRIGAGKDLSEAYFVNVNYDGENAQGVGIDGSVYVKEKKPVIVVHSPTLDTQDPPQNWLFCKKDNLIKVKDNTILTINNSIRLAVGETLEYKSTCSNTQALVIPLWIFEKEIYEIYYFYDYPTYTKTIFRVYDGNGNLVDGNSCEWYMSYASSAVNVATSTSYAVISYIDYFGKMIFQNGRLLTELKTLGRKSSNSFGLSFINTTHVAGTTSLKGLHFVPDGETSGTPAFVIKRIK